MLHYNAATRFEAHHLSSSKVAFGTEALILNCSEHTISRSSVTYLLELPLPVQPLDGHMTSLPG
jgi:hypothetical protein